MSQFQTLTPSKLDRAGFVEAFKDIYEHSPWVAEQAYADTRDLAPTTLDEVETLHGALSQVIAQCGRERQLALIQAHPDLAGKAAIQGELTASSTNEQTGAGIHQCSPEEFERFTRLNQTYKDTFGFPFIMAVKGSDRQRILAAFETRIHHDPETEFACALAEIDKIALFRLMAL
jgi:2-oxo-4-hydroxy-4-carboxy-5-ureidoimidazoline decarboxylase